MTEMLFSPSERYSIPFKIVERSVEWYLNSSKV